MKIISSVSFRPACRQAGLDRNPSLGNERSWTSQDDNKNRLLKQNLKSQKGFVIGTIIYDLIETLVIAGAIFVVIYAFLARPYQVNGHSMDPTYHDGEYVLTNLISLRLGSLKRGDVIVFKSPPNQEKDYIKRVIGLPGDTVAIKNGAVYLNGKVLDESAYLSPFVKTYPNEFLHEGEEKTVPPDNYFVLGDNRPYSSDSREWGWVPKEKLIGISAIVYWPVTDIKVIQRPKYASGNN